MSPRRFRPRALAIALLAGAPWAGWAADFELGGYVDLSLRADLLASGAGDFVFATSTSSYQLSAIDTRSFEELGPFSFLGNAATRARGLAVSAGGSMSEIAAVASNDGYVDFFRISEVEAFADGGAAPAPDFFEADADNEPLAGLAIDALGTRTFTSVPADLTAAANTIASGALTATVVLGHAPLTALAVNTGFTERVWYGCDDGFLAWIDTSSSAPGAVQLVAGGTADLSALGLADFGAGALRLLVLDRDADALYVLDPAGPTVLASTALGGDAVGVASSGAGSGARIWVAFEGGAGGDRVEGFTTALASAQPDVTLPAAPRSLAVRDGRLYAGLADGRVAVISDLPFVEITSVSPSPLPEPDLDVTVSFVSSQSGTARLYVGSQQVGSTAVTSGNTASIVAAGGDLSGILDEGRNAVRVEVTSAGGLTGHDQVSLVFDRAPGAPRHFTVGFGDGRVIGRWDPPSGADDVDHYLVYFGLAATDTSGTATQSSPAQVEGREYVVDVDNGTTVFMSVLAVDSGGNRSARTAVKSATAQPTVGAAELAGDEGGFLCSVSATPGRAAPSFAGAIAAGVAALIARRARRRPRSETPR